MPVRLPKTRNMLRNEAARWLTRLESGRDPIIEEKFRHWYERSPANAEAFDRVSRSESKAGLLRESPLVGVHPSSAREQHPRFVRSAMAAAASIAILVGGVAVVKRGNGWFGESNVLMFATNIGEVREFDLSDGSKVTLDTASSVAVDIGRSRRQARLDHGRARFRIVKATVPFVIEAGSASVTSDEGLVDVARSGDDGHVAVLAGRADVRASASSPAAAVPLYSGQAASVDPGKVPTISAVPQDPDWPAGMLEFDATPLAEAAARANLYSSHHILVDPRVAELRVTGAFHARDTAGFARALAAAFHLRLVAMSDGSFTLSPASPPERKK